MSHNIEIVRQMLQTKLIGIKRNLPDEYRLTLVARHTRLKDADIVMTEDIDNLEDVANTLLKTGLEGHEVRQ